MRPSTLLGAMLALATPGCGTIDGPGAGVHGAALAIEELPATRLFALPRPALVAIPNELELVSGPRIPRSEGRILLYATGTEQVRITGIELRDDPAAREKEGSQHFLWDAPAGRVVMPGTPLEITIRYLPGGRGVARALLDIEIDEVDARPISIPLSGRTIRLPDAPRVERLPPWL
jgi:hypothetical protein